LLVWGKFYPFLHTAVKFKSHNGETDASAEGELCTNDLSAVRVKRSCMLHINGRPDGVFGLFDPIGEKKWSEDWNPIIVYPTSGIRQGSCLRPETMERKRSGLSRNLTRAAVVSSIRQLHLISRSARLTLDVNLMALAVPKLV